MDSAFLAIGIGTVALALSLLPSMSSRLGRFGVLLLVVAGACFFVVSFFPTNVEGAPVTTIGSVHNALSAIVFLTNILAALCLSRSFRNSEYLRTFYNSSMILAIAEIAILIATKAFFDPSSGIRGVVERAFIVAFYSWLLLTSIRIYRLERNLSCSPPTIRKVKKWARITPDILLVFEVQRMGFVAKVHGDVLCGHLPKCPLPEASVEQEYFSQVFIKISLKSPKHRIEIRTWY